jgi:hypothetical protein
MILKVNLYHILQQNVNCNENTTYFYYAVLLYSDEKKNFTYSVASEGWPKPGGKFPVRKL